MMKKKNDVVMKQKNGRVITIAEEILGETRPLVSVKEKQSTPKKTFLGKTLSLVSIKKKEQPGSEEVLLGETLPLASIKKQKKRLTKKELFVRIGILCVLLFLLTYGAIYGVLQYKQVSAGTQHLRSAETLLMGLLKNPFNTQSIQKAQQEFSSALVQFQQVSGSVNVLPGISVVGSAQRLLPMAIEGSQIGVLVCQTMNMLIPVLKNPMDQTGPKLTQAELTTTSQNVQQIQTTLDLLVSQLNQLQPGDLQLNPSLGKFVGTFRTYAPALQAGVNQARSFLAAAPLLLGVNTPANYLLEILDSTELRPGGGFIGNYGTLTLSNGHLSNIFMTDVDLLDKPYEAAGHTIPYPSAYDWFPLARTSWSLRDSNLDADFPTSARNGEQNYALEAGKDALPLQGVIAITPWFIEKLLNVTGPINMQPDYPDTVTAQNLIEIIHKYQLGKGAGSDLIKSSDGHSSLRKRFTSYLAEHLMARVHQLASSPSAMSALFKLATRSLHTKDIQIYLDPGSAENVLQYYQFASTIQAPPGDSLFVVDANVNADKANEFITYTMQDQITIDTSGNAVHHTTLSYAWVLPGQDYGSPVYEDVVHVYVPSGSTLQAQSGWNALGESQAFGQKVWMSDFTLVAGQTRVITLTWTTPKAAQLDAQGWHYDDLLQKQAGDQWNINLQVTLPGCAVVKNLSGGLVVKRDQSPHFSGLLSEDKKFSVDYTCK